MKKISILFGFLLFASIISAQPWLSSLPKGKPVEQLTLFDYQKAFTDYWAPFKVVNGYYYVNGVKHKAVGWKQFHRWFWDMQNQVDKDGRFPEKTAQQVYDDYLKIKPAISRSATANWTNLGTNSTTSGYAGIGRLNCVAFHPTDSNTFWVGSPSGGLWVTKNFGVSWTCLTDYIAVLGVSDIIIPSDYDTSHTIYIATGDKDHWDNRSVGVLKSTDGGYTWNPTGLSYSLASYSMVTRMLLDPSNNQTIIAATTSGVYKTTDGGTTWNTQLTSNSFIDIEYKPGDFNTLYGSTLVGGIYVSTDGGINWNQVLTLTNAARTELAVSPNQPTWVYAVVAGTDNGLYGIYKSTNSGATFSQVFDGNVSGNNLLGWASKGNDSTGQGWYDLTIAAAPSDASTILVGGINTWRSTDGGSNWTIVNHWWGDGVQAVHADKHKLKFRNSGDLFECNDGGIYFSNNKGTNFTDITNGLVTSQMYKLGVSQTVYNEVVTGMQDNGTKLFSGGVWTDILGGDGMECLIDYTDINTQYGSIYYGDIHRTKNHWLNDTAIKPSGAGDGAWITPYIIDPKDHNTLYAAFTDVWVTTNQGDNWTQISQLNSNDKLHSLAISSANNKVICVANNNKIWKTTDGGTNWIEITGNLPIASANITNIEIKNDTANTIWVSMGGYATPGVYESTHGDTIWTDISAGLPPLPVYSIVQNKQDTSEIQLYAGTELGIYLKVGSNNWVSFNTNLPNVKIGELEIYYAQKPANSRLRAATYGRGLWESNLYFQDIPMSFVSCTATQKNISSVAPGNQNTEIICLKIETENVLNPFIMKQLTMSMDGTTNINDVAGIKIYYTGSDSLFAPVNQFASTSSAAGNLILNGTQTLVPGLNYFWISYDLKSTATLGNFIDAKGLSVKLDTLLKIPTDTNPAGSRIISKQYCAAWSNTTNFEYISNVTLGSINQTSARGNGGYEDYSSLVTHMKYGKKDSVTVIIANPSLSDELLIWVDWNMDGDFNDAGEEVYSSGTGGQFSYKAYLSVPAGSAKGTTRMRIRLDDTGKDSSNNTPCGVSGYGEVEDYSINVNPINSIGSLSNHKEIVLYPNPVLNKLFIETGGSIETIHFEILNSIGQSVYKSNFVDKTVIDMSQFSKGFYLIKFETGESSLYRQFVKE